MVSKRPTFVLGVGAQKAGTRFLYKALSQSSEVNLSDPKELHIFDAYFRPDRCISFHERRKHKVIELLKKRSGLHFTSKSKLYRAIRHLMMHYDWDLYLEYFQNLAHKAPVVGEITPSYSMLSAEHFSKIREFLDPHFKVKVFFLMRDPIERIFSAMRMSDRRHNKNLDLAHERFSRSFSQSGYVERSRYDLTLQALEQAFDKESLFFGFHEEMFNQGFMSSFCEFLGIEPLHPNFHRKVNSSPKFGELSEEDIRRARCDLNPVYDYVISRFGNEKIFSIWPHALI